jgi:hypothetical protein
MIGILQRFFGRKDLQEYSFHERLSVESSLALGQGFYLLNYNHAQYLLRHNRKSQPEVLGRVEHQRKQNKLYKVSITPLAQLPVLQRNTLLELVDSCTTKETSEQPHSILFVDFPQHPIQEDLPENVIIGVFPTSNSSYCSNNV